MLKFFGYIIAEEGGGNGTHDDHGENYFKATKANLRNGQILYGKRQGCHSREMHQSDEEDEWWWEILQKY